MSRSQSNYLESKSMHIDKYKKNDPDCPVDDELGDLPAQDEN